MTPTAVRRICGFGKMSICAEEVEDTLARVQHIHAELASIEDKTLLQSLGLSEFDSSSEEEVMPRKATRFLRY